MTALIVVDLQNDFVAGGALAVPDGDAVVPIVNRLMEHHFYDVFATQDWHPSNHGSFAANHPGKRVGDVIELDGLPQMLWPVHCVQNSHGAEFVPALRTNLIPLKIQKGTDPMVDSYSGFFDNGHRRSTGLGEALRARGVQSVFVCGLATDYCVKFTALDAVAAGFNVTLIEDACRGVELKPGDITAAIGEMRRTGVKIVRSADIVPVSS